MAKSPGDEPGLGASRDETLPSPGDDGRPASSSSIDGGRFAPGTILDARYRIVGLLGRGGMGEVYRAEDLKLGEPVALKFLPPELAEDGAALARFHREVRTARQITHKNVVRVHDIGEVDGLPFITMEYVAGEDLSSLLRRIGRLPEDKAVQLARQLCAGLAAAHERGVLHRDLKPANVMIDDEGRAKISDFGLAGLAAELDGREIAGTPAYMAPEQLAEGRASFASDVYSLGLVLYEMFAGRPAFEASSRAELMELHGAVDSDSISTEVAGLDPLIERILRHCLRLEPEARPASALDVAAALPGGDPVAAALAAGETPSPEMVARAGGQAALSGRRAAAVLALTLAGIGLALHFGSELSALRFSPPLEPQVLEHRAEEILAEAGWEGTDSSFIFQFADLHRQELLDSERSEEKWRELAARRPPFTEFVFRQAQGPLAPTGRWSWRIYPTDPPPGAAGVATVRLAGDGRLRELLLPSGSAPLRASPGEPDWAPFFEAAALDPAELEPVDPQRPPPIYADVVRSWRGSYAGQEWPPIRVAAAAAGGRVVWWRLTEEPEAAAAEAAGTGDGGGFVLVALVLFTLFVGVGGFFAHRHLRSGRGDPRGAARIAQAQAGIVFVGWLLYGKHVAAPVQISLTFAAVAEALLFAASLWVMYMALEPFARRYWPRQLTSWTRLLAGDRRNPLVGRDLLLGMLATALFSAASSGYQWLRLQTGEVLLTWQHPHGLRSLEGPAAALSNTFHWITLIVPFGIMLLLVAARWALRRELPAMIAAWLVLAGFSSLEGGVDLWAVAYTAILVAVGAKLGLLALLGSIVVISNTALIPATFDPSLWWSANSWVGWMPVVLLAIYCYRIAGRPADVDA